MGRNADLKVGPIWAAYSDPKIDRVPLATDNFGMNKPGITKVDNLTSTFGQVVCLSLFLDLLN